MSKKDIAKLHKNILQYVVQHGNWRLKRGKRLSAILPMPFDIRNPEKAYKAAKEMLSSNKVKMQKRKEMMFTGQTSLEATLGIPPPWQEPWPGARKVPHTCYEWY